MPDSAPDFPAAPVPLPITGELDLHTFRPAVVGELLGEVTSRAGAPALRSRVHMLGWRDDLDRIYPDLAAVALSSVNEGTPVTLIEGAAAGLPAVSTRVGAVATVVKDGETGILVPQGDRAALEGAFTRLLGDANLRERLGRAAQAHALGTFSAERLCRDLAALYEEILREKGRLPRP